MIATGVEHRLSSAGVSEPLREALSAYSRGLTAMVRGPAPTAYHLDNRELRTSDAD